MLNRIKKVFLLVMFATFLFVVTGCGDSLQDAIDLLDVDSEVSEDFALPSANISNGVTFWTSSNEDLIKIDGDFAEVFRPDQKDETVILTATVTAGDKSVSKDFSVKVLKKEAPEALSIGFEGENIEKHNSISNAFKILKGETGTLKVKVDDTSISDLAKWSVSNESIVTIESDATGTNSIVIRGVANGKTTITVKSSVDSKVSMEISIYVVDNLNDREVFSSCVEYIRENLPKYVSEDFTLPSVSEVNSTVSVKYYDNDGSELRKNKYKYSYSGQDTTESIKGTLTYIGVQYDFSVEVKIVGDLEVNDFEAFEAATAKVDELIGNYNLETGVLLSEDISGFKTSYKAKDTIRDVKVKYVISTSNAPIEFDSSTAPTKLYYSKPNDDTVVLIDVYFYTYKTVSKTDSDGEVTTEDVNINQIYKGYEVAVKGYTKDEIIEYLNDNVLPKANDNGEYVAECTNVTLSTMDTTMKFKALSIQWTSSNENVLSSTGKFVDIYTTSEENVTLVATITYDGTTDSSKAFTETIEYNFTVKPGNEGQIVALQLGNCIAEADFVAEIKHFPFGKSTRLDENGNITNVLPLPKYASEISNLSAELAAYKDLEITWSCSEEGLLDENYTLKKQYLRYHEVPLTYSITVNGVVATGEIIINVGIASSRTTRYYGGFFANNSNYNTGENIGDILDLISRFDEPVGSRTSANYLNGGTNNGMQFGGYTFYIEVGTGSDAVTHRFYGQFAPTYILDDQYSCTVDEENSTISVTYNKTLNFMIQTTSWGHIFVNTTDHEIKIPMASVSSTDNPAVFKDASGNYTVAYGNHPYGLGVADSKVSGLIFDGYATGFVCDKDGNVVFGNGNSNIQELCVVDDSDVNNIENYWVTIPAGGFGVSFKYHTKNRDLTSVFCNVGTKVILEYYEPYYLSPDGDDYYKVNQTETE